MGSGTTGMVARSLGRHAVGIDLNPEYLAMAVERNTLTLPMAMGL
jgi:DNA modification methylase